MVEALQYSGGTGCCNSRRCEQYYFCRRIVSQIKISFAWIVRRLRTGMVFKTVQNLYVDLITGSLFKYSVMLMNQYYFCRKIHLSRGAGFLSLRYIRLILRLYGRISIFVHAEHFGAL